MTSVEKLTATQAIETSVRENRTVFMAHTDDLDFDLLGECKGSCKSEFWGATHNGSEWRVHLLTWIVAGQGADRDYGRAWAGEVSWVRSACRTRVPEGAKWFATGPEAMAATGEVDVLP